MADKLRHHDERAGRRFGEAQAIGHLAGRKPAKTLHHFLRHVPEHGIGAAKGDDRKLRKRRQVLQHMIRAEGEEEGAASA